MLNIEQERDAFNSWFYASKYAQIVPPTKAHEHAAWDGWKAGRAALAAAPQVPAAPQWLAIETAPKDCSDVLLLWGGAPVIGSYNSFAAQDRPDGMAWFAERGLFNSGSKGNHPTHWMPLPAAPGALQPAAPAPLDVCTDPYNCKRCDAPPWAKHKFEHAGIASGVKEPT